MRGLPEQVRQELPTEWHHFNWRARPWLVQFHYHDPAIHYEVWNLGKRRGKLEIGYHFESKNRALNTALLAHYLYHLVEIKDCLGAGWIAEQWDKGWTKVYTTIPYEDFTSSYQAQVAATLAQAITIFEPLRATADLPEKPASIRQPPA